MTGQRQADSIPKWITNFLLFYSVAQSCLTLCNPVDCSMPGFPVLHYLLEFAQVHVHWDEAYSSLKPNTQVSQSSSQRKKRAKVAHEPFPPWEWEGNVLPSKKTWDMRSRGRDSPKVQHSFSSTPGRSTSHTQY